MIAFSWICREGDSEFWRVLLNRSWEPIALTRRLASSGRRARQGSAAATIRHRFISAGSGLLGTIIGGLITYFTQRSQKTEERANEIRTTAHGIGAELRAFVDLVSMRNHDAAVQRVISFIQSGQDVPLAQLAAGTGNPRDYFPIFYSRLNSLGSLDEEIADLAKFHTQLAGIYATLARLQTGTFDNAAADAKVEVLQTELALWRDTLVVGRAVATRLLGRA